MKHNIRIKEMNEAQKLLWDFGKKAEAKQFNTLAIISKSGECPEMVFAGTACGVGQLLASALNELCKQYLQFGDEEFENFKAGLFAQRNYSKAQLWKSLLTELMKPFEQAKND